MNIEKFTERSRGFLQAASTIALRDYHQQLTPEHLLKALLDDPEGAASGLIRAAGGDPEIVRKANDAALARLPKVQGGGAGQPQATPDLVRALDTAEQDAQRSGDSFVAQDRLLVALAGTKSAAGQALTEGKADAKRSNVLLSSYARAGWLIVRMLKPVSMHSRNMHATSRLWRSLANSTR